TPVDALLPPAVDSYSSPEGVAHGELAPPPVAAVLPADYESYVSYEGEGQVSLVPPALSSYAHLPVDASGADVLASLASMVHLLPPHSESSYTSYEAASPEGAAPLPTGLVPPPKESPSAPGSSSYSEVPREQPELAEEQIRRAQEAEVPVPSRVLLPPPRS
ncbi:wiskott-Aldrich syndrome protein family member 3-like, partial [Penaeus japonicus]|uniref:wiskott-Aldrich syndrome protein family member 3-like n=1 Tax=Penaeus japonicus TaxID=27405 RepID=UPI001C70EFCE